MKPNIDPFIAICFIVIVFSLTLLTYLFITDIQERKQRADLIKQAIEQNWTSEQIKDVLKIK